VAATVVVVAVKVLHVPVRLGEAVAVAEVTILEPNNPILLVFEMVTVKLR
jgi:hypothetical protein